MARFVLTPLGWGDVSPFVWLGRLLTESNHRVEVIGPPMLGNRVIAAGFDFTGVGHEEDYSALAQDPDVADPARATKLALQFGTPILRAFYDAICLALTAEPAVVIAPIHHLAARAVKEKYPIPFASVRTQPCWPVAGGSPATNGRSEDWLLEPLLGMNWVRCRHSGRMTAAIKPAVRKFCIEIGIKVPRRGFREWSRPTDLDILLYPEWFSEPSSAQSGLCVSGFFPPEVRSSQFTMPADLRVFLNSGAPPVLLSLENSSAWSQMFFETGMRACRLLGVRVVIATTHPELLPQPLPPWVHAMEHHPFGEVLPRVLAVVHDGGIGTLSQCLAAGVPQLIAPTLSGQQGNAARLRWLGVGESLIPAQFSVQSAAASLLRLSSSPLVRAACESVRSLCVRQSAGSITLEALERLARGQRIGPAVGRQADFAQPCAGVLAAT